MAEGDRQLKPMTRRRHWTSSPAPPSAASSSHSTRCPPCAHTRTGWSVSVTGLARRIDDPVRAAHYKQLLHPWVAGNMSEVISIDAEIVNGFELTGT